ncbi:unnamed protein product, partial [Meganyctiphanes norvegica]
PLQHQKIPQIQMHQQQQNHPNLDMQCPVCSGSFSHLPQSKFEEHVQNHFNESQEKESKSEEEEEECKICFDAPIDCVLVECGHLVACMMCGEELTECPICRETIINVIRTYRS